MFQRRSTVLLICVFIYSSVGHSQEKTDKKSAPLTTGRITQITYGSKTWNTDSGKVDSAYLIIRDKASGKLVQINLEETEPDSSEFKGQFSLSLGDQDKLAPEVYIPPQALRKNDKDNKKLYELIQNGKLPRKPLITKKNSKGQTVFDVYDTREQAESALKAYEEEQKIAADMKRKKPLANMTNGTAVAAVQDGERKTALDKMALEATKHDADRIRMEQIEKQKNDERVRQQNALSEKERAARKARAVALNAEGFQLFNAGNFDKAEGKFKEATSLDPDTKEYYYKYGVALYRNNKFNEALVTLKIAKVDASLETERSYYMGLVHYRLGELDNAVAKFDEVGKSNDKVMGPSAVFYQGVIWFTQEKYDPAKKAFEKVIDTSSDPNLDTQAEEYIDRVAGAMAFKKMRENKWTASGVLGMMYDSNVLLTQDNGPAGTASNVADARLLTVVDLQFRPIFDEKQELSPHVSANLTNSAKTKSAPADPFIYTLASPYSFKGTWNKRANKFTLTPGYELLYMDPTDTGTKTEQQASYYLSFDDTIVMHKNWFQTYSFEYRNDDSKDASSVGIENLDATKYTLRTVQTFLVDKSGKEVLMSMLGYTRDAAKGKNKVYNRFDLGVVYARPGSWDTNWNVGLAYYKMVYPTADVARTDVNVTLSTGITKPIREWVTWGVSANYTKNSSDVAASTYTKYMILTTATFNTNF